jgi:altronate hydrolase
MISFPALLTAEQRRSDKPASRFAQFRRSPVFMPIADKNRSTRLSTALSENRRVLRVDVRDNVLIALVDLPRGDQIAFDGTVYELVTDVPAKHKFTTVDLEPGNEVVMYGVVVGKATQRMRKGELISTRNLTHHTSGYRKRSARPNWQPPHVEQWRSRTFRGYVRADGQVGTRNYWLVAPLVFCENRNVAVLRQAFEEELGLSPPNPYRSLLSQLVAEYRSGGVAAAQSSVTELTAGTRPRAKLFENFDGVKFLMHEGGCGGTREDANNLCGLLAGYIHHPNVAGATVLSLGCQHSQVNILKDELSRRDPSFSKPLLVFEQQQWGSEAVMLSAATRETFLALAQCNNAERTPVPLSKLCVGLKCGSSDGFSGITANPALGHVSDILTALGATTILSEFPELCGVEQELIDRCKDDNVAERFVRLMSDYAARAHAVRSTFALNPSPGNIKDGLITGAMKSAGAAKKGGTSPITAVLDYPEYVNTSGLNLQCTPGNDVECVTAQVGAGANIVLFTTGLGTPTGNPIAPVVKVSTNSRLSKHMPDLIDVDTGAIIAGEKTIEQAATDILEFVIRAASGETKTKAELLHQDDFIFWKRGVSL